MSLLSWLYRQIYITGLNNHHFKEIKKAALESTKAAVRRLSIKCAQELASPEASKTLQKSKKRKSGHVSPERYRLFSNQVYLVRNCAIIIRRGLSLGGGGGRGWAEKLELSSKNLDTTPPPKKALSPLCYVKNKNSACAGRFLCDDYKPNPCT